MEKSSKNSSDLLGEEKSNESSNKNSSEKEKDDESDEDKLSREEKSNESDGDKSGGEEKSDKSESEQSDEKEEEGIESSPDYVKIIVNAIPSIQRFVKNSSSERTIPRIIKWMAATPAYKTNVDPIYQTKEQVDEILSLMRKRQIWFSRHYNQTDLILDLNFYNTLYAQYKNLSDKSLVDGAPPMHEALILFEIDNDMLNTVRLKGLIHMAKSGMEQKEFTL
ncbi:hypothetical protein H5410_050871 [Solanum commersonii]|uniref:Uncharacterized protein n=1 Tax=Solanum commersonii TaxID=4109 RepID=A0A9J5WYV6_SOLCO|nr:hypothetical protein H5410_050871 [Solanum commersonii]